MPIYCFKLHDGHGGVEDQNGVSLRDSNRAVQYAHEVVHELMRRREVETRPWRLDVYEAGVGPICQIRFASIDPTLDHLTPEHRRMVETMSERKRSLSDACHALEETVQESWALVARSRGKPYLATRFGKTIIRNR